MVDVAGLCCLASYLLLAWYSRGAWGAPGLDGFFLLLGWATVPAVAVFALFRRRPMSLPVGRLLLWAGLFRLSGVVGVPLFEDDWFRYLWDGYRFAEAGTPYGQAPAQFFADPAVPVAFQRILDQINHPDLPTIYGPTTQLAFLLSHLVAPGSPIPLQILLIAVDLMLVRMLLGIAPRPFVLLYAWCPLVIKEIAFTVHPDGIGVCFALAALLLGVGGHPLRAALCLALAVGAKIFALVLVPFVLFPVRARCAGEPLAARGKSSVSLRGEGKGRAQGRASGASGGKASADGPRVFAPPPTLRTAALAGLVFLFTLGGLYAPFIVQGGSDLTALAVFAREWEFNAALFALIAVVLPASTAKATLALAYVLAITAYWCHWRRMSGNATSRAQSSSGAVGASPLTEALPRADWIFGGLLLVSPVINPWYALWFLPFAAIFPSAWAWTASCALLISYITGANLGTLELGPFAQPWWVRPLEFGLIFVAFCADLVKSDRYTA